jgi:outer membrane protein assembly factor BamB
VAAGLVFVPCKDGLAALRIDASKPSFSLAWEAAPYANSAVFAYGLVWTVASDAGTYRGNWKGTLYGLDPASGAVRAQLALGLIPHYPSPAAAGGSLYVSGLGVVYAVSVS